MIERLLKHRESIDIFFRDRSVNSFTEAEWVKLKTLSDLLRPLKVATKLLGGEKYATMSIVLPHLAKLVHSYQMDDDDPAYVTKFKKAMLDHLRASQSTLMSNMLVKVATALDPRFKKLKSIPQAMRVEVWEHLVNLLKLNNQASMGADAETTDQRSSLKRSYESSDDESDSEEITGNARTSLQVAKQAVETYRAVPQIIDESTDPLTWWHLNHSQHPALMPLVMQHLCCPGTSVPSERLFSRAGSVITTKRASLLPSNANALICLSS